MTTSARKNVQPTHRQPPGKKILTEKQQPKHRQTKITKMIFNCRDEKLLQSTTENMPTDGWVGRMMVNQTV